MRTPIGTIVGKGTSAMENVFILFIKEEGESVLLLVVTLFSRLLGEMRSKIE